MAKKGINKKQKTLSAPKSRAIQRKTTVWTIKDKAGTHRKKDSVPLAFAIRNLLKLTETIKETKKILNQRKIKVNAKTRTNKSFPIGLFDLIEIETNGEKKYYRAVFDSKRRIQLIETNGKEQAKICRIENKKIIKGKKTQYTLNDGTTTIEEIKAKKGDSIKIGFPEKKTIQTFSLEKGNTAFILSGKHTSKIVKIESIIPGTQQRDKIVEFNENGNIFKTSAKNIFVIGKDKADKTMELNYNE
jgi:small subunit ribosomal protein S4e